MSNHKKREKNFIVLVAVILSCLTTVCGFLLMSITWESLTFIQRFFLGIVFAPTPFSVILALSYLHKRNL